MKRPRNALHQQVVRLSNAGLTTAAIVKETGLPNVNAVRTILSRYGVKARGVTKTVKAVRRLRAAKRLGTSVYKNLSPVAHAGRYHPFVRAGKPGGGSIEVGQVSVVGGISYDPGAQIGRMVRNALKTPPIAPVKIIKPDGSVEVQDATTFRREHSYYRRRRGVA